MTTIYFKDKDGRKVTVEVSDKIAAADAESRRVEWRNNAKEKYYRGRTLDTLTDDAIEYRQEKPEPELMVDSPEEEYIKAEEQMKRKSKLIAVLKTLTPEQLELVKMLRQGKSVTEIAAKLKVSKAAVSQMRKRIQEKFKEFLK